MVPSLHGKMCFAGLLLSDIAGSYSNGSNGSPWQNHCLRGLSLCHPFKSQICSSDTGGLPRSWTDGLGLCQRKRQSVSPRRLCGAHCCVLSPPQFPRSRSETSTDASSIWAKTETSSGKAACSPLAQSVHRQPKASWPTASAHTKPLTHFWNLNTMMWRDCLLKRHRHDTADNYCSFACFD